MPVAHRGHGEGLSSQRSAGRIHHICARKSCPNQGHGQSEPVVNGLPPRERMQQTIRACCHYIIRWFTQPRGVILGSPGNFLIQSSPPPPLPRPGLAAPPAGETAQVPASARSPTSQRGLYFGLMIWVNGSVLLTDGSLPGVPAKAGSCTPQAGGQRLGNAPR